MCVQKWAKQNQHSNICSTGWLKITFCHFLSLTLVGSFLALVGLVFCSLNPFPQVSSDIAYPLLYASIISLITYSAPLLLALPLTDIHCHRSHCTSIKLRQPSNFNITIRFISLSFCPHDTVKQMCLYVHINTVYKLISSNQALGNEATVLRVYVEVCNWSTMDLLILSR